MNKTTPRPICEHGSLREYCRTCTPRTDYHRQIADLVEAEVRRKLAARADKDQS